MNEFITHIYRGYNSSAERRGGGKEDAAEQVVQLKQKNNLIKHLPNTLGFTYQFRKLAMQGIYSRI